MKTIGILGGMSWESSAVYYRLLNEMARERLGGLHSCPIIMHSFDFHEIERLMSAGDWDGVGELLATTARSLEEAGAQILAIATNTIHLVADRVSEAVDVPLVHLVDAVARDIRSKGMDRVGLLGTKFTMEMPFYRERLARAGIEVVVPDEGDRGAVNRIIFEELCLGRFETAAKDEHVRIIADLAERGAQGVILGCTEIPMLVGPQDSPLPLFDTTAIHVRAMIEAALQE